MSPCEIKKVYPFLLLRRSLVTKREEISVALWEGKPDCGGQKNEWEVRKGDGKHGPLLGDVCMRDRSESIIPLKGCPSSPD